MLFTYLIGGTSLTLRGLTIRNCINGVYGTINTHIITESCSFINSTNGINAQTSFISLFNSSFDQGHTAIRLASCTTKISGCFIRDNTFRTGFPGSGIVVQGSANMLVENTYFANNYNTRGGALLVTTLASPTSIDIVGCEFVNNTSILSGGVFSFIDYRNNTLKISNCSFVNNSRSVLLVTEAQQITVTHSNFTNNRGTFEASCIQQETSIVTISNCNFNENEGIPSTRYGALDLQASSTAYVIDSTFSFDKRAIFSDSSSFLSVSSSTFINNFNPLVIAGRGSIDNSTFSNNNASAILLENASDFIISSSTISSNMNTAPGGGLVISSSNGTIISTTFSNNNATIGGAVSLKGNSIAVFRSCNFTENSAYNGEGGAISGFVAQLQDCRYMISIFSINSFIY